MAKRPLVSRVIGCCAAGVATHAVVCQVGSCPCVFLPGAVDCPWGSKGVCAPRRPLDCTKKRRRAIKKPRLEPRFRFRRSRHGKRIDFPASPAPPLPLLPRLSWKEALTARGTSLLIGEGDRKEAIAGQDHGPACSFFVPCSLCFRFSRSLAHALLARGPGAAVSLLSRPPSSWPVSQHPHSAPRHQRQSTLGMDERPWEPDFPTSLG